MVFEFMRFIPGIDRYYDRSKAINSSKLLNSVYNNIVNNIETTGNFERHLMQEPYSATIHLPNGASQYTDPVGISLEKAIAMNAPEELGGGGWYVGLARHVDFHEIGTTYQLVAYHSEHVEPTIDEFRDEVAPSIFNEKHPLAFTFIISKDDGTLTTFGRCGLMSSFIERQLIEKLPLIGETHHDPRNVDYLTQRITDKYQTDKIYRESAPQVIDDLFYSARIRALDGSIDRTRRISRSYTPIANEILEATSI